MYENLHNENGSFSKEVAGLQISWDSTSLGYLKTCPRMYQYRMLDNWSPKGMAIPLIFGILYHSIMEEFERQLAYGLDHEEAVRNAIRKGLELSWFRGDEEMFNPELHKKDAPWESGETLRNRPNLIRAVLGCMDTYKDNKTTTVILDTGEPAVELTFSMDLDLISPDGKPYALSGHMDRVVLLGGDPDQPFVLDYKTTKAALSDYYFGRYNPDNQVSLYTTASKVVLPKAALGVIIEGCQLAVGFNRYARSIITRSQGLLDEWWHDVKQWIKMAEQFAYDGYWPMNDTACDKYGGCDFKKVCERDPKVRCIFLKSDFEQAKRWDPTKSREAKKENKDVIT